MTIDPRLAAAESEARMARARLTNTLARLQTKIKPANVAHRAVERVKEAGEDLAHTGMETAQEKPWAAAGVGAGLVFLFLRKPIKRLVDRATGHAGPRSTKKSHAKGSNDD
jgi:ElaB/YqjD/DUF883 family membrane-anchored ribosome-binding protein